MKKPLLFVLLLFFAISCKKDDGPSSVVDPIDPVGMSDDAPADEENEEQSISITEEIMELNLDGLEDVDFSKLQALSPYGESDLDADGNFKQYTNNNENVYQPILIIEGEDVVFGYDPKSLIENEIEIDDILLYFVKENRSAILFQPEPEEINFRELLLSHTNYGYLKETLQNHLKQGGLPFENQEFIEKAFEVGNSLIYLDNENNINNYEGKGNVLKSELIWEYAFSANSAGWKTGTINGYVGIQAKNELNEIVYQNIVRGGTPFNISYWLDQWTKYFDNTNYTPPNINAFENFEDGKYSFRTTNGGESIDSFSLEVRNNNSISLILEIIGLLNIDPKSKIWDNPCAVGKVAEAVRDSKLFVTEILLNDVEIDRNKIIDFVFARVSSLRDTLVECSKDTDTYFDKVLKKYGLYSLNNYLSNLLKVIDVADIVTHMWDTYQLNIDISENHSFFEGKHFGEIRLEDEGINSFIDDSYRTATYKFILYEAQNYYRINRSTSEMTKEGWELIPHDGIKGVGNGLTVSANVKEGDVEILSENPIKFFSSTLYSVDFRFLAEDSTIKITPDVPVFLEDDILVDVNMGAIVDLSEHWVLEPEPNASSISGYLFKFTEGKANEFVPLKMITGFVNSKVENELYFYNPDSREIEITWDQLPKENTVINCDDGSVENTITDHIQKHRFVGTYSGKNQFEGQKSYSFRADCDPEVFTSTINATFKRE